MPWQVETKNLIVYYFQNHDGWNILVYTINLTHQFLNGWNTVNFYVSLTVGFQWTYSLLHYPYWESITKYTKVCFTLTMYSHLLIFVLQTALYTTVYFRYVTQMCLSNSVQERLYDSKFYLESYENQSHSLRSDICDYMELADCQDLCVNFNRFMCYWNQCTWTNQ